MKISQIYVCKGRWPVTYCKISLTNIQQFHVFLCSYIYFCLGRDLCVVLLLVRHNPLNLELLQELPPSRREIRAGSVIMWCQALLFPPNGICMLIFYRRGKGTFLFFTLCFHGSSDKSENILYVYVSIYMFKWSHNKRLLSIVKYLGSSLLNCMHSNSYLV